MKTRLKKWNYFNDATKRQLKKIFQLKTFKYKLFFLRTETRYEETDLRIGGLLYSCQDAQDKTYPLNKI